MKRFVHQELYTNDVDAARKFYADVFGWDFMDMPQPDGGTYVMFDTGDGTGGGLMPLVPDGPTGWLGYVGVENLDDTVVGIGAVGSFGGAVWRGDLVVTDADDETRVELVANLSYSWTWADKNVSGAGEYFRSGDDRNYFAGSLMVELSPLWSLSPALIGNIDDPSAVLQIVTQYSLGDNATFLGSLNLPLGGNGTEFGGPETGIPGRYLSYDVGVFAQLAWYF